MDSNRTALIQWIFVIGAALLTAWLYVEQGPERLIGLMAASLLFIAIFSLRESYLPILLLLTLALGSSFRWDVSSRSFYLRFFVLAVIAVRGLFLFLDAKRTSERFVFHRMSFLHLCMIFVALFGASTSILSVSPTTSALRALSFVMMVFVVYVYLWLKSGSNEECAEYADKLWFGVLVILGIGFLFLAVGVPGMFKAGRLNPALMNPNTLGHYCALMAPLAVWFLFERARGPRKRMVAWGVVGMVVVALLGSGSRGALGAAFAALFVQFFLCYRGKLAFITVAGVLGVSIHFLLGDPMPIPTGKETFLQETVLRQDTLMTMGGRKMIWQAAWHLIEQKPYFGYGFGSVDHLFRMGYFPEVREFQGGHVHNSYLQELVNLGWVGATPIFLGMAFFLFVGLTQLTRPMSSTQNYRLAVALFCMLIAGLISGIAESWFTSVGSVFCFPFWLGAMLFLKLAIHLNDWKQGKA